MHIMSYDISRKGSKWEKLKRLEQRMVNLIHSFISSFIRMKKRETELVAPQ